MSVAQFLQLQSFLVSKHWASKRVKIPTFNQMYTECIRGLSKPTFHTQVQYIKLSCDLNIKWEGITCNSSQHIKLNMKGPGTTAPFSSSFNIFRLHRTMTHLAGSSSNRAAAVSWPIISQVFRRFRLQRSHHGSRQLVDKAPHSIMDDQNSWLCMYDN